MPLIIREQGGKKYLYYSMKGARRLYLGTLKKPKIERVYEAINFLHGQIRKQEEELRELESLLPEKPLELKASQAPDYKLIAFSLDGVIYQTPWHEISSSLSERIAVSTWDVLFQELGIYNVHEKLAQNYAKGFFKSYREWTEAACRILKSVGLDKKTFQNIINRRPLSLGAVELFKILRNYGIKTAVITGSFEALAQRASRELGGFDYILAHCKLIFNDDGFLEDWELNNTDYKDKAEFIRNIAKENQIPLDQCAYVGDDVNDIEAFKIVGCPIAFNCRKPKVLRAARVVIESNDLRAILPHLYKEKEENIAKMPY